VLTRRTLQEYNDEILNGHEVTQRTSGSTGTPVRIHMTAGRRQRNEYAVKMFLQHLGAPLQRMRIIDTSGQKTRDTMSVMSPVDEQLEALLEGHKSRNLCAIITYPNNATILSQTILERQLDFGFILRLGLMSESIDPAQRRMFQQAFPNAKIWSNYSSVEFNLISFECPYFPEYHHASTDKLAIEILNDHDQHCAYGEIGRVVITDYFNYEMPLIRYEIGDLAAYASCPCGKISLPALSNILGKVRGCLKQRDGTLIPYIGLSVAMRDLPGLIQFQVIQEELEKFTVKIAARNKLDAEINAVFLKEFGYAPDIIVDYVDSIPRDPSGKFFGTICKV
jgi:phenylacetate-CoA ligase